MTQTTLMKDCRNGKIGETIKAVAKAENIDSEKLCSLVAKGLVTIPKNVNRNTKPVGIGKFMSTKINANVGTSRDYKNMEDEVNKAKIAVKYGAGAIMDLSTGGDLDKIRERILAEVDVPVGTVPLYDAAATALMVVEMTSDDMFNAVRRHAEQGVDFVTVHAGINKNTVDKLMKAGRITDVVSRGGSFTVAWMSHNDAENPFYAEFDYLLEIAQEFDVTLSLGDGMRPGCIHDAADGPMFEEILVLGELVKRSRAADVQTFVEGPGHVPLDKIEMSVKFMKETCYDAPLYLLGPIVTDIAPGFDHITSAIGGSIAGMAGTDFLCMVSPSEHLALPTAEDIKTGMQVAQIAAHATDLVKEGVRDRAKERDDAMGLARKNLNWEKQYSLAIDPDHARAVREARSSGSEACSMCGDLCAMKIVERELEKGRNKNNI
ncbi:phosphomethylpyrimidine synthase ThiC [Methanimicrococcus blatticola]|uniref:Phosphomethylpyrimidine synthase n=1 Tax=Methanimicrococcus blatticola TaxID=91560 RepID=A0A484F396_9EURY|nr:phosphomethylpyrimidine synthase ThiC [Methanimicrococcus blatticola]MBZ3936414.1 phosphomethylpyrimidine synthase ThiC [Methanimicrococcus blatticola]MCC2509576.1 phosphomethylpyrimidine synthase ThiC [Methanimicrococcus blatticola]TDQ67625.1 hydroxymethylpyrimidine synthase [Methanimicrococcus blatticola]